LQEKAVPNVTLKLCPFDFKNPVGFERSDYLHAMPEEKFDVIVVDGSEEWTQVRPICFEKAEERVNEGGIIVVDDSWRYPTLRKKNRARDLKVFESVGPCRPGVTSTDIFFY
jgi:spermidine synthase